MNYNQSEDIRRISRELKDRLDELDQGLDKARVVAREVVYKIILLCSTIIGFSLTLISIPQLDINVNVTNLRTSWYLFLTTIVLGFLSLFVEGRIYYALKWRAFQIQDYDETYSYPLKDRITVSLVCAYSFFFPRNLFLCKTYKTQEEKKHNALLNAKVVQTFAELTKLAFVFENLFIVAFVASLIVFVTSYR